MADEAQPNKPDTAADELSAQTCRPCRGSGSVISGLGGTQQSVTCPWCEGSGQFLPDHDAQAARGAAAAG